MELTVFYVIDIQKENRASVKNGKVSEPLAASYPSPAQPAMARLLQSASMHSQCSSRSYAMVLEAKTYIVQIRERLKTKTKLFFS